METLLKKHKMYISQVSMDIVRETMKEVRWEKQLVAIKGSRGVGKTTLIRQYIRRTYGINADDALYCVMDSLYFTTHSLLELAERFYQMERNSRYGLPFLPFQNRFGIRRVWSTQRDKCNDNSSIF